MNLTFLIPVKIESEDRVRNLSTVLIYLLSKFDAFVSVKECDHDKKFEKNIIPILEKKFGSIPGNLEYEYENQTEEYFHKTKILNDLLIKTTTDVVCNYDTDVLLPQLSIQKSYELIVEGKSDAVYPYGCGVYQKSVKYDEKNYIDFINSEMNVSSLDEHSFINNSTIGWCQFIRRSTYINSFMMNENFKAWGPEDCELFYRLNVLGNRVGRINDYIYHLEHARSNDSWFSNPYWNDNNNLWGWIRNQSKENIISYYRNQDYIKRRSIDAGI